MRLNPIADLHINAFSGAGITEKDSGIYNGMVDVRGGINYLTQRPSIDLFEDASVQGGGDRGRGIIYWDETSALYIINDGTLYKSSQSNSISTSPTAGTTKCHFLVLGATLILIDPANNQAFNITNADVVSEVTDVNFPPKQTPAVSLAYGGAVLDQYLFVMGDNGVIYNSALNDGTTWGALDFKEAEREPDAGIYLGKHHDNLAALGATTIEFFYDAANPDGSPLNRRQDVAYNIGCSSGESVWEEGDRMFFVGVNYSGALGVYTLENFSPRKISTTTIDSFLTQAIAKDGYLSVGSGLSAQGHIFYILTLYHLSTDVVPDISMVYDDTVGLWYEWETTLNSHTKFPLVGWTKRRGEIQRYGEGILSSGDLITLNDNLLPQDTLLASGWVEDGWVETGWVASVGESSTGITMKSRMGQWDGGTDAFKYPKSYRQVSDESTTDLTLRWANENNTTFTTGKTLKTSKYSKTTRNGRFRRRNHEIEFSGAEIKRIEAIEVDI